MAPDKLSVEQLNRWAAQEFRSVNGQIEFLLQRAVDERTKRGREQDDDLEAS